MLSKEMVLTQDGVAKLEHELEHLKAIKRKEVALRIKQAMAFGDLSENAEYDEAKKEQAFIEGRIATLENMLKHARIIDDDDITTDKVSAGSTVKVLDPEYDEIMEFTIVGSAEADPAHNRISNESPVGNALLDRKVGEEVSINVPDGNIKLKILEIWK
jgi:transcription elongation factor GreA